MKLGTEGKKASKRFTKKSHKRHTALKNASAHQTKDSITSTISTPPTSDLKAKLYNPKAIVEAMKIADENAAKSGLLKQEEMDRFINNHPLFSDLHLVLTAED